jgi:integrase
MPLKLIAPRIGKTPFYSVRGTYLGIYVDRSTKTANRATAARFLSKWREEIECGELARPGEPTFLDAAVAYMGETGNQRFMPPLLERLGKLTLRQVTQQEIDKAALALYPRASAATRNRQVHTVVSAVLKHAGIDGKLRRPKGWRGEKKTDWLWPEQAFAIFEKADKIDAEFGIFLRFLTYTGARLSEATVRFKTDRLSVSEGFAYFEKTKNEDPRGVHLPPVLIAALANHPRGLERPGQTVFRFRKNGRLYALLNALRKAVGPSVKITGFHIFRHTWGTWMRRYGGLDTTGLVATQAWRDAASARRYEHAVASEEARKADLLPVEKTWTRVGTCRKAKQNAG